MLTHSLVESYVTRPFFVFDRALPLRSAARAAGGFVFFVVRAVLGKMASEQEMRSYIQGHCQADLSFLFTDIKLALDVQYNLVKNGISTIGRMATTEDNAEDFKKAIAEAANIDIRGGLASKIALSDLKQIWKSSQERHSAEMQAHAAHAASSGSIPMPVPLRDYAAMEWAHRQAYGDTNENEAPGKPLVDLLTEQVVHNDLKALPLTLMASAADGEEEVLAADFDLAGALRGHRRKVKVIGLPVNTEALRTRFKRLENAMLYLQLKHNSKAWLQDFSKGDLAHTNMDYLLGDKVYHLKSLKGGTVPWQVVIDYDMAMRKKVAELVKWKSMGFKQAMLAAMADTELRQMCFIEELAVKRGKPEPKPKIKPQPKTKPWWEKQPLKVKDDTTKKGGKGHKRGKAAGKGKTLGGLPVVRETPDRRLICFKYNHSEECDGQCGMVRCYRVQGCLSTEHPLVQHPGYDASA